ncbi:MAG: D-aminoacyl-tRNA deacylase [Roseburia sp.]|nr:D-aminoacyl-tRNA deacylase [Roseburia sp.]MCM1279183.1 D-aminoacyl-tRNA deacylase [Robinsoniella sp.]
MKFVIQRVSHAAVTVENKLIGAIQKGFLVFVGVSDEDTEEIADKMVSKMLKLRIFEDQQGKTNLSLHEVDGGLLIVSQFTLYADCRKGNRPSFVHAGAPEKANQLYEYILQKAKESCPIVEKGEFGADMKIELQNDGPFTIILDSDELF